MLIGSNTFSDMPRLKKHLLCRTQKVTGGYGLPKKRSQLGQRKTKRTGDASQMMAKEIPRTTDMQLT